MEILHTDKAPAAIGPYSQAIETGGLIFASGQLGLIPDTGALAHSMAAQTVQALENVISVLKAAGLTLNHAMEREIALACDEEEKKEREKEGERKALKDCVAFKYPKNDLNWIDDCNEIQCQMIKELLFQDLSYEQFYESIQKYIA